MVRHTIVALSVFVAIGLLLGIMASANAATDTWTGATDTNWNTTGNWTGGNAVPAAGDTVVFGATGNLTSNNDISSLSLGGLTFGTGAGAFNLTGNSIALTGPLTVNAANSTPQTINFAVAGTAAGSLVFGSDASGGNALTLNNNDTFGALSVGSNSATANVLNIGAANTVNITGALSFTGGTAATNAVLNVNGGTLNITNTGSAGFSVGSDSAGTETATVNMGGLSNFIFSSTTGVFSVGLNGKITGNLTLANATNTITTPTFSIGNSNGKNGATSVVHFNGSTVINAGTFTFGNSKGTGNADFVAAAPLGSAASPALKIRAQDGVGRPAITVGSGTSGTGFGVGTLTLTGHYVDILANGITLGNHNGNLAATNSGTLIFDNGVVDATTVTVGTSNQAAGGASGTLTIGSAGNANTGTLIVGTGGLVLGNSSVAGGSVASTLNIRAGGVVMAGGTKDLAKGLTTGPVTATINLEGGILDLQTRAVGSTAAPIDTFKLPVVGQTATIRNLGGTGITATGGSGLSAGGLVMGGTGSLILAGNNSYSGATSVTSGSLLVNGTLGSGSAVDVSGGTLGGNGSVAGTVTLNFGNLTSGATLGASSGTLALGGLVANSGNLMFSLGTSVSNTISVNGPVTFNSANLSFAITGSPANGSVFTLLTATSPLAQGGLNLTPVNVGRGTVTPSISGANLIATVANGAAAHLTWTGSDVGNPLQWDNFGGPSGGAANWTTAEAVTDKTHFYDGDFVTFAGAGQGSLNLAGANGTLTPGGITVSAGAYSFNGGPIGGAGSIAVTGSGNLTLNNSNTNYSGNVSIGGGTLTLAGFGAMGTGTIALNSGTLNVNAAGSLGTGLLTIGNGATLNNNSGAPVVSGVATPQTWVGDFTFTGAPLGAADLDLGNGAVALTAANSTVTVSAGTLTVGGAISGTGDAITKVGNGTLLLKGDSTFTGGVTVNAGILQANKTTSGRSPLGSGNVTVNAGGTLVGGNGDAFGFSPNPSPATIFVNGGTITDAAGAYRISMPNLNFTGGTLTSDPGNTGETTGSANGHYSLRGDGTTATITTNAASSTAVISAGIVSVQSATTFNVAAGNVVGGATPGVDLLVSSTLKSYNTTSQPVTKTGAGTLVFNGNNTYTGVTNINAGKLVLQRSTASLGSTNNIPGSTTVNVASSGTLDVSDFGSNGGFAIATGQTVVANGSVTGLVGFNGGNLAGTSTGNVATVNLGFGKITPGASSADGNIGTINIGSLTSAGGGEIRVDGQAGNISDLVNVTGTANFSGGAQVSVAPATPTGTYTILTAGSLLNSGNLSLLSPSFNRFNYSLNFSQANKVLLNVIGGSASLTWNNSNPSPGDGSTWDIQSNNNWTSSATSGNANQYYEGDAVSFTDANNNHYTVNLAAAVNPASVTVNNSAGDYTFGNFGGSIGGTASLTKNGTRAITLTTNNNYSGGTTLNAGTLNIGTAGTTGVSAIGTGILTINGGAIDNTTGTAVTLTTNNAQAWAGSFAFTGAADGTHDLNLGTGAVALSANPTVTVGSGTLTIGGIISGASGFTKDGAGTLVLSGANTYAGPTNIVGGTLKTAAVNSAQLGPASAAVNISGTGALDIGGNTTANNQNFGLKQFNVSGAGPDGNGAIVNNGLSQTAAFQKVTLTGDATFGGVGIVGTLPAVGSANGRFDIRAGQSGGVNVASLDMAGHTLTKKGLAQFTLVATTVTSTGGTPGAIVVDQGELGLETTTVIGPSAVSSITMNNDTRLEFFSNTAAVSTVTSPVIVAGTNVVFGPGNNGPIIGSPVTLKNDVTFVPITTNAATPLANPTFALTWTGAIGESGGSHGIIKDGPNVLTLSGNNTYTGATTVVNGTLRLGAANRIADTSNLVLGGGVNNTAGTFSTGGFDEKLGSLTVNAGAAANTIDLTTTGASLLRFDNSSALSWTGNLAITNWSSGLDRLFVGTDANGLNATQLAAITINGGAASILSTGELYTGAAPQFLQGDWDRNNVVNAADIKTMLAALTNLDTYKTNFNVLTDAEFLSIGDINSSGSVTNADIQSMLALVASLPGGGSLDAVPEPSTLALAVVGLVGFAVGARKTVKRRAA